MSDEERVRQLDRAWNEAYLKRDLAALTNILADDWIAFTAMHEKIDKPMLIEGQRQAPAEVEITFEEGSLHLFGATAVTTGRVRIAGVGVSVDQRYTRVYTKRQGGWQAVLVQVVPG